MYEINNLRKMRIYMVCVLNTTLSRSNNQNSVNSITKFRDVLAIKKYNLSNSVLGVGT